MKKRVCAILRHGVLIAYMLLALVPFVWLVLSAFKDNTQIFTAPFALPESFRFDNFQQAWVTGEISTFFWNSVFVSVTLVVLQLFVVSMATFAITRIKKAPRLKAYFMIGLTMPVQALLIPDFLMTKNLGLMNTPFSVIFIYSAIYIPFGIFVLSGFMEGIPRDLDEAASIDGASYFVTYSRVILPVCKPGLATIATFIFLNSWNEFQMASVLLTRKENMVLTEGINYLKGQYVTEYGLLCAGLLITIVPVVIVYVFLQEQVVKGMTAGAVKG